MTTPDDPLYENTPSAWNNTHALTLAISATEISNLFSNKNGVSFGLDGTNITGSIAAGGAPGSISAGTTNVALGEAVFSNSNGVSFGLNGATVTATVATNYQSQGAYLTTAMLSNAATISNINVSAGTTSNNLSAFTFGNGSGVSFGLNGSVITASVAAAGGAQTGISGVIVSDATYTSGTVSFSNQANITIGSSVNGATQYIRLSGNAAQSVVPGIQTVAFANTTFTTGGVSFSNANGISFGSSGAQVTASHNALTTAMASNRGTDFVQATAAFAGTSASGTIASGGISVSIGPYITTGALSNHSHGVSFTSGSVAFQTLSFTNSNGISFNSGTQGIFGSHNAITTGRASTDAIGLNTAQTNVTWTVNSSGLSFNAGGYAGTATGFTGANISGTFTHNTAGLSMSLSVAAPGAAAENNWHHALGANTAGNTTASGSTIGLSGINLTISGTNGSVLNLSVPATSSLVGANNISISTAGSTITVMNQFNSYYEMMGYIQGTTAVSNPGASSVLVQPFLLPYPMSISYIRLPMSVGHAQTSSATTANRSWTLRQLHTFLLGFYSLGAGANSRSLQYVTGSSATLDFMKIYQIGAASNNQSCSYSGTVPSEGGVVNYTTSFGVNSASMVLHTTVLSNSLVGNKWLDIPFAATLSAGPWWVAIQASSTTNSSSAGGNWANITAATSKASFYGLSQPNFPILPWGVNTSASTQAGWQMGLGIWTTNTNGFTSSSMALSHIVTTANHPMIPMHLVRQA